MIDQLVDVRQPKLTLLTTIFLRAYRYFMTADDLLERLIYRYCSVPEYNVTNLESYKEHQVSVRLRVLIFLKNWITRFGSTDFGEKTLRTLSKFVKNTVYFTGNHNFAKQLSKLIDKCTKNSNSETCYDTD